MADKMQPIPFKNLINWIISEYSGQKSIFGIPSTKFHFVKTKSEEKIFGENLETPFGPAAGPHTQMTQNIISAYLVGGRFFELKTVQKLDNLKIDKPCIDAQDEGYNVEWSQELSLDESYNEYLKAWFLIHLLKELLGLSQYERGFVFNMSVGYDLDGIKTGRMNRFLEELKDARKNELFSLYKSQLIDQLRNKFTVEFFKENFFLDKNKVEEITKKVENISPQISNSVTLSTMHGCPPQEIEAIAKYLIQEKNLHTYVKLNPTLLGYDFVHNTLHKLGYKYIVLEKSSFDHDLQYKDAVPMLNRLRAFAAANNRVFGIKLSNTLGVKNTVQVLQGNDMYMSGRSIFPLTINLANKLAIEFNGEINISYSGGATNHNIQEILQTGISPITLVTDLLKPGGYLRLSQITETAGKSYLRHRRNDKIDLSVLKTVAEVSLSELSYSKDKREIKSIKLQKDLPIFDCFIAPCQEACPIHQDVAAYIRLVEQKRYEEAFELIVSKNPLPHITGYICDHQCMYHCTRWDYDDPVLIRDLKKEAAENGYNKYLKKLNDNVVAKRSDSLPRSIFAGKQSNEEDGFANARNGNQNIKCAVIGAGPSGLSAAYFLAKSGFDVTIFEREMNAGGIVKNVLPRFRLPEEAIVKDIEFIEKHGIRFVFGMDPNFSIEKLKKEGFKYIYIAIGAEVSNKIQLDGNNENIFDAIDFLKDYHDEQTFNLGKSVAIIGGGNSAMDSARAATRYEEVKKVYLLYRRTKEEMPADKEEFYSALKDGVEFRELILPVKFTNGVLTCQRMKLDKIGEDGRKNVLPIDGEFEEITVDSVIHAIGENVDTQLLMTNKISLERNRAIVSSTNETMIENVFIGGDALRGPSTVVESIADGKITAEAIIRKENLEHFIQPTQSYLADDKIFLDEIKNRRGELTAQNHSNLIAEAERCLGCNFICNKCVEVCPNRANIAVKSEMLPFKDKYQILHIDALCNDCGNCQTFCPYQGSPYKNKPTLFLTEDDFKNSRNNGFFIIEYNNQKTIQIRWKSERGAIVLDENGEMIRSSYFEQKEINTLMRWIKIICKDYSFLLLN